MPLCRSPNVQHLSITQPGGMPGSPVLTGVARATNGLSITWDGPSGYYQLFEKQNLTNAHWQAIGRATNLNRQATIAATSSNGFFRVSGPARYTGSQTCAECHSSILSTDSHTLHAGTFTNAQFIAAGGQSTLACLPCHTVGYGLPTGFISLARTPRLANVQCENCHGPAANHAANRGDPTLVPRVEVAATVCGGCHTTAEHPTFDEWSTSAHTQVIPNLNATNQIDSCGRCHSGSARLCLIKNEALPVGDTEPRVQCMTCHDPHQTNRRFVPTPLSHRLDQRFLHAYERHFRQPLQSQHQCLRPVPQSRRRRLDQFGAAPPHFSPQYNMLLGSIGELVTPVHPITNLRPTRFS